jgi:hypothetical protein
MAGSQVSLPSVYVSALVLGNVRLPHGPAIRGFAELAAQTERAGPGG